MKFLKKNQIIIGVMSLMLIAAGYLNFTNHESDANALLQTGALADSEQMAAIGDATLVSTTPSEENAISNTIEKNAEKSSNNEIGNNTRENIKNEGEENKVDLETNAQITTDEYFTKSRLERDTLYSQMIESYQKILDKTTISEKQRITAQSEITRMNEEKNAIMITENLIKTKGFEDLIIFINNKSINVIVKAKKLEAEQIAQIQNIITRELKAEITNIHISNKE